MAVNLKALYRVFANYLVEINGCIVYTKTKYVCIENHSRYQKYKCFKI